MGTREASVPISVHSGVLYAPIAMALILTLLRLCNLNLNLNFSRLYMHHTFAVCSSTTKFIRENISDGASELMKSKLIGTLR